LTKAFTALSETTSTLSMTTRHFQYDPHGDGLSAGRFPPTKNPLSPTGRLRCSGAPQRVGLSHFLMTFARMVFPTEQWSARFSTFGFIQRRGSAGI
jgi:hypothetical protein